MKEKKISPENEPLKKINFDKLNDYLETRDEERQREAEKQQREAEERRRKDEYHKLSDNYQPHNCILCDTVPLSAINLEVMTAIRSEIPYPTSKLIEYRYFIPLTLLICENCLRAEGMKIKQGRVKRLVKILVTSVAAVLGSLAILWLTGTSPGEFIGCLVMGIGLFGLLGIFSFFTTLHSAGKHRKINPEIDPLIIVWTLFDEHAGAYKYFEESVKKAVSSSRDASDIFYWSIDDFNKHVKPHLKSQW